MEGADLQLECAGRLAVGVEHETIGAGCEAVGAGRAAVGACKRW